MFAPLIYWNIYNVNAIYFLYITRLTRQPFKKNFKLDRAFMNNVEKRQTACLILEDYHYDILNNYVKTVFGGLSSSNIEKPTNNVRTVLMLRVCKNLRKNAFDRSPPSKSNTRVKDVWFLSRYC